MIAVFQWAVGIFAAFIGCCIVFAFLAQMRAGSRVPKGNRFVKQWIK